MMASYLSNLVARTLGEGEIVQSRPVSRFEPLPRVGITPFAAHETLEEGVIPTAPDAPLAAAPIPFPQPLESPVPGTGNQAPTQANPPVEPVSQPARPVLSVPTPPPESPIIGRPAHSEPRSRVEERREPLRNPMPFSPLADVRPGRADAPKPESPGVAVSVRETRVREVAVEHLFQPVEARIAEHHEPSHREATVHSVDIRRTLQPPPVPDVALERYTPSVKMFTPQVQPFAEPSPVPRQVAQKSPEPAPTVHVTIGRIEVRATTPPAPTPRKKSNQSAVMSLDEYLKGRANRGRR